MTTETRSIDGISISFPEGTSEDVWARAFAKYAPPVEAVTDIDTRIDNAVAAATAKGEEILKKFTRENIKLGIEAWTIDNRPATDVVLERTASIVNALRSGSTKAARRFCLAIPEEFKDSVFITDARLLEVVNEIETFHGMPLTASL
jgi:hypothetical protein